jgi:dienelactone hydrolase
VIGICGGIRGDWDTADHYKSIDADILYLSGTPDEFYTPERIASFPTNYVNTREVTAKSYDAAHEMIQTMREDVKVWLTGFTD